jgi:hypothetical protein
MNGNLLITTSVVLVIEGMVTRNLTSTVSAHNDDESKSTSRFTMSQMINGKEYTNSNPDASINSNPESSSNCDSNSQCGKTMKNVMGMMGNLFNATIP